MPLSQWRDKTFLLSGCSGMVSMREKLQVLHSIVQLISIEMMDVFCWLERTAKFLLHNIAVLTDSSVVLVDYSVSYSIHATVCFLKRVSCAIVAVSRLEFASATMTSSASTSPLFDWGFTSHSLYVSRNKINCNWQRGPNQEEPRKE